jgi:hypothetical protein
MTANILVLVNDGFFEARIQRILSEKGYSFVVAKHLIRSDEARMYRQIIIHASYRITHLFGFIENLILHEKIPIILLCSSVYMGQWRKLNQYLGFSLIDEMKMDAELPLLLSTTDKYAKQMQALMQENKELRNRVGQEKMFNECKNRLIAHGMSEDEAHRYIIKRAMDEKQNKYVMAQKIFQELCDGCLQV